MKKDWENATLGEVCHVYQPQTLAQKALKPGPYPVFGANGQIGWHSEFNHENEELVLGCRGSVGTVHVTPKKTWINGNAMVVRPKDSRISLELLRYAFLGGIKLVDAISGTAQPQITRASLSPLALCFPTARAQQDQLSKKLDEAFAGLAKAKENAEKNLQNARALFESHLEAVFTSRGPGWVEKRLGDICKTSSGGTPLSTRREYYERGDIPWLLSGEVAQGNVRTAKNFITKAGLENSSAKLFPPGTVLIAMYGATAGQVGILRLQAATNQAVCGILPNENFIPEFLFYYFLVGKKRLVAQATGNAQPNISQIKIKNTKIPTTSVVEQQRIVELLKSLHADSQCLERLYKQKLVALESLKKSILHEAFSGNL